MSFLGPMQTSSSGVFGAILRQWNIPSSRCLSFSRPVQSGVELKHAVGRSPAHHQGLESEEDAGLLRVNSTGDFYIDLGRKRRATVSSFKGTSTCFVVAIRILNSLRNKQGRPILTSESSMMMLKVKKHLVRKALH